MNVSRVIRLAQSLVPGLYMLLAALSLSALPISAQAQSPGTTKHDSNQPIEITADQLDVQQEKQLATFSGNVQAAQGDIRLRAANVQVHYRAQEGDADVGGAISKIMARGEVFFSSPGQTARGDTGVYDVDKSLITMEGKIVLTREDNVIRGNRLVLNLATGQSTVSGGAIGTGGRVRGLFVPNKKKP